MSSKSGLTSLSHKDSSYYFHKYNASYHIDIGTMPRGIAESNLIFKAQVIGMPDKSTGPNESHSKLSPQQSARNISDRTRSLGSSNVSFWLKIF